MKVLIIENGYNDLKKSRFPLGEYFQKFGFEVYYACPRPLDKEVFCIPMSRNSASIFKLFEGYFTLTSLEHHLESEIVLSFRLIPNVLNYLASFKNSQIKRIAVITGLGYAFMPVNSKLKSKIQRLLIIIFYRLASKRIQIVAQNSDDLKDLGVINGNIILGSGVNQEINSGLAEFYSSSVKLLYVGRLLKSKGFLSAIEIFEKLLSYNPEVTLTIAGTLDLDNPDSISEAELAQLKAKKGINYLGFVHDVDKVYTKCNVLLFPSIYREGVPRVVVEALKHGLTIITSNMPGCKETVTNNGFLITHEISLLDVVDYLRGLNAEDLLKNRFQSISLFENIFCAKIIYPKYLALLK